MFFNSFTYLAFLIIAGVVIYTLPYRIRWIWILLCSVIFYYTILPTYLILFIVLTLLNYWLGLRIERTNTKKRTELIGAIVINLMVLALFKYFGFFGQILNNIGALSEGDRILSIILPIGLSFFIFSILSYLIEIKRKKIRAEAHLGIFAASMLFFPKIMQGPIEKPGSIISKIRHPAEFRYSMIAEGVKLIIWGYFKKLVVADRLSIYVDAVYGNIDQHSGVTLAFASFLYSIQIYADFSGYTDIALGSARILGIELTNNFMRPYFATSAKEFWNRWHISFSIWLRDYVFLPLAYYFTYRFTKTKILGLSAEKWVFLFAVNITFIICGLWHGEGMNFLVWGFLFGVYQTSANWSSKITRRFRRYLKISKRSRTYKLINIPVTFILVTFAWIFFRASSLGEALQVIERMVKVRGSLFIDFQTLFHGMIAVAILLVFDIIGERNGSEDIPFRTNNWLLESIIYAIILVTIILFGVLDGGQFIYFQF